MCAAEKEGDEPEDGNDEGEQPDSDEERENQRAARMKAAQTEAVNGGTSPAQNTPADAVIISIFPTYSELQQQGHSQSIDFRTLHKKNRIRMIRYRCVSITYTLSPNDGSRTAISCSSRYETFSAS